MSRDSLSNLIERAGGIPDRFDELKSAGRRPMLGWDELPDVTLHKLETAGRVDFRCAVRLLRDPLEAYGAEIHVRSLIELMATVGWITGFESQPPDVGGARQRALCFELGVADELRRSIDKTPERFHMGKDTRIAANRRYRAYKKIHDRSGCGCGGRRWLEARVSLERIIETSKKVNQLRGLPETDNRFEQYRYLYATASAMAHLGLWDRILQPIAPGVTDFVPANYQVRGSLLGWTVHTYGTSCLWILDLQGNRSVRDMANSIDAVLGDRLMREAGGGHMDRANAPA